MSGPRRLATDADDFEDRFRALVETESTGDAGVEAAVRDIVASVRARGDAALLEHTRRLDRLDVADPGALRVDGVRAWPRPSRTSTATLAPRWNSRPNASASTTSASDRTPGATARRTARCSASR